MNIQNLPKSAIHGVDIRGMFRAPKGKVFVSADYSAIEAVCLLWIVGDQKQLDMIANGLDVYESAARASGEYTGSAPLKKADPALRHFFKVQVLGCGYGVGAKRFVEVAANFGYDLEDKIVHPTKQQIDQDVAARSAKFDRVDARCGTGAVKPSDAEFRQKAEKSLVDKEVMRLSHEIVNNYRSNNPLIKGYWAMLQHHLNASVGSDLELALPSGRALKYHGVRTSGRRGVKCATTLGKHEVFVHGPLLTENVVQAISRDILADLLLRLDDKGYEVVGHFHDEVLILTDEDGAEGVLLDVLRMMRISPEWADGLPLKGEGNLTKQYRK